ncbi:hypothetical protein J3T91_05990 [Bifidobacterium sp. B4001]|uniref:hypothetical protein n=1 Tax=unclassified Bifidobacterium TaxID=2608897 RepID=UPI00226BAC50|nr:MULTISPECIES: hypothetical protein [unclassified Bifidobacterium]MCX8673062.1 hypothetical protein [Bifidobacterium sp. B4079]MCX8681495.1 hypothetical protein [Bifidobacterium sp. B4001]
MADFSVDYGQLADMSRTLNQADKNWEYEVNTINVDSVQGEDGLGDDSVADSTNRVNDNLKQRMLNLQQSVHVLNQFIESVTMQTSNVDDKLSVEVKKRK